MTEDFIETIMGLTVAVGNTICLLRDKKNFNRFRWYVRRAYWRQRQRNMKLRFIREIAG